MKKKILLVEPAYKTKYPPLGLMKLSAYHKMKGDEVRFVKGLNENAVNQFWDRVYIGTLFTWTWAETVKTIKYYYEGNKLYTKCYVGGILASLLQKELYDETGVYPIKGLLDDPKKIEQDDSIIIDKLPPDYDILKQVETQNFRYEYTDAYLGYATRGCPRECDYCAVRVFEPTFIHYIDIKKIVKKITDLYGEKKHLLLMDNNVLVSNQFDKIINDIKVLGFSKKSNISVKNGKKTIDFNQGLDARLLTEAKMQKLAEISLEPMRIAFDDIKYKDVYVKAVRLAHKYGQVNMSNYVLYNFKNDTPEDFYERLKINIELNEEFKTDGSGVKTNIYSFPMRFIPIKATRRNIPTGNKNWNKRYLRSVKAILNVTKGVVMPGSEFFYQAFGRNADEFKTILSMPDSFITNRLVANWKTFSTPEKRCKPYVRDWMNTYSEMSHKEVDMILDLMSRDDLKYVKDIQNKTSNKRIRKLLRYYLNADATVSKSNDVK